MKEKINKSEAVSHSSHVEEGNSQLPRGLMFPLSEISGNRKRPGVAGGLVVVVSKCLTRKWEIEPPDHRKATTARFSSFPGSDWLVAKPNRLF